jgi:hypothetical protein
MGKRAFVHIEIPAADRLKAAGFYSAVFGWEFQDMPEMNYTTFTTDNVGGGFNPLSEQVKVGDVIVYLDSPDIEADLKIIEAHGGKTVIPKTEIPGVGWFALFSDPTGNVLALYSAMPR